MGILAEPAQFVRDLDLPKGFSVCELGDQWVTYTQPHILASEFYAELGCGRYVSIDGNGRGTVTADLNRKLGAVRLGQFDLVTDFGTGEHVFNQAQVWRTVHELTRAGGFIVFDRPSQGYETHCFYLTNETLFRDLAAVNGYSVLKLEHAQTKRGRLIRGVFRKGPEAAFSNPQQGRYQKALRL